MKGAGNLKRRVLTEETVSEFCLVFAKIALQLAAEDERGKAESTVRLFPDANFDAGELRQLAKETNDCMWILDGSGDK